MFPRDNWYIGSHTTPPTRLQLAQRHHSIAGAQVDKAKEAYVRACNELAAAIADERAPKACTCCPTCGGKR